MIIVKITGSLCMSSLRLKFLNELKDNVRDYKDPIRTH